MLAAISQSLSIFSSAILGFCKVLYVSSLSSAHVCFYSARTVHAQCTATVHGLETLQIPQKIAPRLQNIEKTGFKIFYPYTISCARTAACTVRALSKHKHSAYFSLLLRALVLCCACRCCLPLGELVRPQLEHLCEPWCFAAACALASSSARSWNTLVSFKGPCSISRYLQTFWGYFLQKSCLLVFWLSC